MIILKTISEINKIRESSKLVAEFLNNIEEVIHPGTNLCEIEELANKFVKDKKVKAGFKGYESYPFAVCTSVNSQIVHGFPNHCVLKEGDIISVDFGILKDRYYGDAAKTYAVGKVSEIAKKLIRVTEECLYLGIEQAIDGNTIGDISKAIQTHAEENGFSVSKSLVGHGIGRELHEKPPVPNVVDVSRYIPLKEGMVIAIEPIIMEGLNESRLSVDGWTEYTADNKLAAHFEHTVHIQKNKATILSTIN